MACCFELSVNLFNSESIDKADIKSPD